MFTKVPLTFLIFIGRDDPVPTKTTSGYFSPRPAGKKHIYISKLIDQKQTISTLLFLRSFYWSFQMKLQMFLIIFFQHQPKKILDLNKTSLRINLYRGWHRVDAGTKHNLLVFATNLKQHDVESIIVCDLAPPTVVNTNRRSGTDSEADV